MKKITFSLMGFFLAMVLLALNFSVSAQSPILANTYTHSFHGIQFNYPSSWSISEESDVPLERVDFVDFAYPNNDGNYVRVSFKPLDFGMTTKKWFNQQNWPGGKSNLKWWTLKTFVVDDELNYSLMKFKVVEDKTAGTIYFVDHMGVLYTFENGISMTRRVVPQKQLKNIVKSSHFLRTTKF